MISTRLASCGISIFTSLPSKPGDTCKRAIAIEDKRLHGFGEDSSLLELFFNQCYTRKFP
jgi:hypothetical protein